MSDSGRPGASLRMWREYFPKAHIYGADIDKSILFQDDRITTAWVNQLEPSSIKQMYTDFACEKFDLIIDDGLHTFEGGRTLYENSINHLAESGIYIVEDVGPHDLVQWVAYFNDAKNVNVRFVSLLESGLDRYNNNIVIVTHVNNAWRGQ
jgi:23S rRNA U2552 (ribose-2'-O)-methylase RlmE/FtsJ